MRTTAGEKSRTIVPIVNNLLFTAILAAATAFPAHTITTIPQIPPDIAQKHAEMVRHLAPTAAEKIHRGARALRANPASMQNEATIELAARTQATMLFPDLPAADIEALAFLVLMDDAKSAQDDLNSIMSDVQAINAQKQSLRATMNGIANQHAATQTTKRPATVRSIPPGPVPVPYPLAATATPAEKLKRLEELDEMSETENMRLQMAQDPLSKFMSTLSNILKKMSDTSSSIVQNLK